MRNKLLLFFILVSGLFFGQQKELFKAVSYTDVITLYNSTLKLKNESLAQNIERCKYIIEDANKKRDGNTAFAFSVFLKGLTEAEKTADKNTAFISVYKDTTSYNFYDSSNQFAGRIYKEKFDPELEEKGNNTETYVEAYFNILQE
ncbi:MAG: hypothetical protein RR411_04875 [Chryseobacterium sp.]|uniref:hypothetical protein n=1 Tax=Chryseobacterium sp. TaxID=1871047 RepID=UPI002FCC61A7